MTLCRLARSSEEQWGAELAESGIPLIAELELTGDGLDYLLLHLDNDAHRLIHHHGIWDSDETW
jgi:hypothetical protein